MGRSQQNMGGFSQMGFWPQCFSCSGLLLHRRFAGSDPAQPLGPLRGAEGESRPTHLIGAPSKTAFASVCLKPQNSCTRMHPEPNPTARLLWGWLQAFCRRINQNGHKSTKSKKSKAPLQYTAEDTAQQAIPTCSQTAAAAPRMP